ncbi:hypothetical protein SAMN05660971_02169 [Halomonas cupida]|uniref:Uncharacterized protein n=1 Tax=Halomonas cupida TaxID=44933 RepID=A0A1M7G2Q5_9GAMM|nr:hypothetical protein SAMN05660971_02169 [Halomonas cupida]
MRWQGLIQLPVLVLGVALAASGCAHDDLNSASRMAEVVLDEPSAQECGSYFQSVEVDSGDLLLAQGCCRVCRTGKACGNSCINRHYTCHKGSGCACDG